MSGQNRPPLRDWPFNQPDDAQMIMFRALAGCSTPEQIRDVLSAFLVGDLMLGLVAPPARQPPPSRLRRWRPW